MKIVHKSKKANKIRINTKELVKRLEHLKTESNLEIIHLAIQSILEEFNEI